MRKHNDCARYDVQDLKDGKTGYVFYHNNVNNGTRDPDAITYDGTTGTVIHLGQRWAPFLAVQLANAGRIGATPNDAILADCERMAI
jgi:hypothetical protein